MLCPEGAVVQNEPVNKEEEEIIWQKKNSRKVPTEGTSHLELSSFKNPKTWKKSISNFFRNQLRSTKSNDGDEATDSKEDFEEKELSPEQKWQSLGKMFKRSSLGDHWKSPNQQGESSSPNKRLGVKKVLSSYFGKTQKSPPPIADEN